MSKKHTIFIFSIEHFQQLNAKQTDETSETMG